MTRPYQVLISSQLFSAALSPFCLRRSRPVSKNPKPKSEPGKMKVRGGVPTADIGFVMLSHVFWADLFSARS